MDLTIYNLFSIKIWETQKSEQVLAGWPASKIPYTILSTIRHYSMRIYLCMRCFKIQSKCLITHLGVNWCIGYWNPHLGVLRIQQTHYLYYCPFAPAIKYSISGDFDYVHQSYFGYGRHHQGSRIWLVRLSVTDDHWVGRDTTLFTELEVLPAITFLSN